MTRICCVCQKRLTLKEGKTFLLTDEEKAAIGDQAVDEVYYCTPCLNLMEKPENQKTGAQLLKGMYEMKLRRIGVGRVNARKMAQRFYEKLIESKKPKNLH